MTRHFTRPGLVAAAFAALLSACGGGGDSASPETTRVSILAAPADVSSTTQVAAEGDDLRLPVQVKWASAGPSVDSVYLQVRDSRNTFDIPPAQSSTGTWSVDLPVRTALEAGVHEGQLEVRACKDSACAALYPGASTTVPYRITLAAAEEWTTHQGSNDHRAARPVQLDPARFRQVWAWQRPASNEPIGGINPVVTMKGKVLVTTDVYFGEAVLHALNESNGQTAWTRSLGSMPAFGPPAVSADRVFAATAGHADSFLWGFDLQTGAILSKSAFDGQWPHLLAPTLVSGTALIGAGYYGGEVYAYSMLTGDRLWSRSVGGVWDMYSVAADDQKVYHYNGASLIVLDRATGTPLSQVDDLLGNTSDMNYHGGPILGTQGLVFAYSGGAFSGRAASNVEAYGTRVLSAFDPVARRTVWNSAASYRTTPAVAAGAIYVGNDTSLDALDEATGRLLWRFIPDPVADGSGFHRNAIVTRNHLFVSTDTHVLAIDLRTRAVVWRHDKPGLLALSAGRTLYINVGARESTGELVAVRLR